ncbi:MAG: hypothetical protein HY360_19805 [Verrucomicrobia bacterium]|nr:hypothetical protein [Verrucomicrobiota bacterium]
MNIGLTHAMIAFLITVAGWSTAMGASQPLLQEQSFLQPTMSESGLALWDAASRVEVFADRQVYFADDVDGQFLVAFLGKVKTEDADNRTIQLELKDAKSGKPLETKRVTPVLGPKLPVIIPTMELKPGQYELTATLKDELGNIVAQASRKFERSTQTVKGSKFPSKGIPIFAHAQSHVPDGEWPITTGVPMPKGALKNIDGLALLENGNPVPSQFIVRATWSPNGWVKWVGVDFIARYDKGNRPSHGDSALKPREYRLVKTVAADAAKGVINHAPTILVGESPDKIVVNTGVIRFEINPKQFAGIEKAWIGNDLIVDGLGGSFVVDDKGNRFDSAYSKEAHVVVEENGPVQTTIAAKGWYCLPRPGGGNEAGEPLCKFVIRFKAYAGQPFVSVSHFTINTIPDQYVTTKLADVGFEVVPSGRVDKWHFGFDGKSQEGAAVSKPTSIFLHQDRGDHFRLMADDTKLAEGKRSDGWMTAQATNGSITYFLRDVYQKFPKELELDLSPDAGRSKLVAHFWPKHGHKAFTEEEELARDQIYKVRYAHQGKLLNFLIPDNYHKRLEQFNREEPWAGDHELMIVDAAKNLSQMQAASGQGTVISSDLIIRFDAKPRASDALRAQAGLIQQSPHALPDPKWSCATDVLGPVAPRDPEKFGSAEKLLDTAYSFYRRAIIEAGDEYGLWIYGGVHSSWESNKNQAQLTRVWQSSHYQNVFQAWLLYFRSGLPEHFEWARMHSSQYLDVGVCNYLAYPKGAHSYSHIGDIGGGINHCKGFMPWTGRSGVWGHWIDIENYFIRYYLTGDRRGLDMAETWIQNHYKMRSSNALNLPTSGDGYQDPKKLAEISVYLKAHPDLKKEQYPPWIRDEQAKPPQFNPREVFVPLGEMTQYYQATWNPQALIYLNDLAEYLNPPFERTNSPSLSAFGKHWQDWYYDLTRDPRVINRIKEHLESERRKNRHRGYDSFAAFLYHTTGDTTFLKAAISGVYSGTLNIYECEGDRYDGYCLAHSNPEAMLLGRLPYFLHAVDAAGLKFERNDETTVVPTRNGRCDIHDKGLMPPRGWSNTGVTILSQASKPTKIAVSIQSYGQARGFYQLFYGFPELDVFKRPNAGKLVEEQHAASLVKFEAQNLFKDPPECRNYGVHFGGLDQTFPYIECPRHDPSKLAYRLEHGGTHIELPVFLDAETQKPLSQVAVIARTTYANGKVQEASFSSGGVTDVYFRPLDDKARIQLNLKSAKGGYTAPTTFRIWDARGQSVMDSSVFMAGKRSEISVTLDPGKNPIPWRLMMASYGDNQLTFTGADELFFARKPDEFNQILSQIPIYAEPAK